MNKVFTAIGIALRIWVLTALFLAGGVAFFIAVTQKTFQIVPVFFLSFFGSLVVSIPAGVAIFIFLGAINKARVPPQKKTARLSLLLAGITAVYGLIPAIFCTYVLRQKIEYADNFFIQWFVASALLFSCSFLSVILLAPKLISFFFCRGSRDAFLRPKHLLFIFSNKYKYYNGTIIYAGPGTCPIKQVVI